MDTTKTTNTDATRKSKPWRRYAPEAIFDMLHGDQPETAEIRFQLFMEELEAHADPSFADGTMPQVNEAAGALLEALILAFGITRGPELGPYTPWLSGEPASEAE